MIFSKFFIGTKTMKFIANKKAGQIKKDWELNDDSNSFNTDNSFQSEEMDDFKEAPIESLQLKRKVTNTKLSFTENLFQSRSVLAKKYGPGLKTKIKSEAEKMAELRAQEQKTK